ncbi:hypothetical protein TUM19329_06000 [Legionella antarctica]|uniref:Protein kinase domain-containing protein n=1 Tax=Legionella antarctica TaxID=2708020 RepID=A0A6F8T1C9_9GAMM|nr:hypothetical protein TUM19329_06000 [Legionella antarctica]
MVKKIIANQKGLSDKTDKPNWFVRSANREHYLGSQLPTLGMHYGLIREEKVSFLHMNRAPGLPLKAYVNSLNAEQFLSLACTLLEEIPQQIHQTVRSGKHQGEQIVHCDLKSENIMAEWKNNKWTVTAVDMGLAKTMQGNGYSSWYCQGNKKVWDTRMFYDSLKQTPITYDAQTDLYALYITIAELAGAPSRTSYTKRDDFKNPDLIGIFDHMDFDPITKKNLIVLIGRMITDDRSQRISRDEALNEFKEILLAVQKNTPDLLQKRSSPASKTVEVDAEALKHWVEYKLEHRISTDEKLGLDKGTTIKVWIKRYRELCLLKSAEANPIPSKNPVVRSRYIHDLMRFNLIEEYDDNACVRLLLRNEQLTAPLRAPYPLNETWKKFFDLYLNQLPIQLTVIDESFCEEISTFKNNVSSILSIQVRDDDESLLGHLTSSLKLLSKMQFTQWAKQLPLAAHVFNQQFKCMVELSNLFDQFKNVFSLKDNFSQDFNDWATEISENAIIGQFPNDSKYFEKYHTLASYLIKFSILIKEDNLLFKGFPDLNQSEISFAAIMQSIENLKLDDTQCIEVLSKKLDLLFTLTDVFYSMDHTKGYPHTRYPIVLETGIEQVTQLINKNPSLEEFTAELNSLLEYFATINELDAFIKDAAAYKNVVKSFLLLMNDDQSRVLKFKGMLGEDAKLFLGKLEQGLTRLLSMEAGPQLNDKLFVEMIRFIAFPLRYHPMGTGPKPNTLFQPIPIAPPDCSKEEEELFAFHKSL